MYLQVRSGYRPESFLVVAIGGRACLPLPLLSRGYSLWLLYRYFSIPTDYLPYPYAAPTRAMQGVTSYKSLVLILIHGALLKWV